MNDTQWNNNDVMVLPEQQKGATHNRDLMGRARETLKGKWGKAIGVVIIYLTVHFSASLIPVIGPYGFLIISGPFSVGFCLFYLSVTRNQTAEISQLFSGFNEFWKCFVAYFMSTLFILLWSILLIIPGIVAAFSYAMIFFIIADNPEIKALEAIKESKKIMYGHRWKFFCLQFRFVGWWLLCMLTLGIGCLWLLPYIGTSNACFYEDIKHNY